MGQKRTGVRVSLPAFLVFALCGGTETLVAQTGDPTVDPAVESKLTAADAAPGNFFGAAVALDGRTAVVGAHQMNVGTGAAYVFHYSGNSWTQTTRLTASDGVTGDQFGRAVAIGNDTIVVGAENLVSATGAAYVFELQGTTWVQTQKLTASDPQSGAHFGASVTIDGNTLLVGAYGRNSLAGAAYVFERSNGTWQQTALLVPSDVAGGDTFSRLLSLQGDTALLGSAGADSLGGNSGSAYIFTRSNGTWTQSQKLLASDGAASDLFGLDGSISGDTLVIGARGNSDRGTSCGSAYVFQLQSGTWTQTAKLLASDGRAGDVFGHSARISGNRIVIGAKWRDDNSLNSSGAAYVFEQTGGVWAQTTRLNASDAGAGDEYTHSVAIDGPIILVGAHRKSADRGAAYAYHPPNTVAADQSAITAEDQLISAYGGETRIVVTPRKSDGSSLGTGLVVELSTSGGSLVGAVTDNGDGTYSQTLQGTPGTIQAVVSAVVEGLPLAGTATVTLLPVSLSVSTVTVNPDEVIPGESATVTVTPKTDTGTNSGPGLNVTIETTLGTLTGQVLDNGDGTYSQQLSTSTQGTASISASVSGLPLSDTATLAVKPKTAQGQIIGIGSNGTPIPFKTIQDAVDHATDGMKIMLAPGHFDEVVRIRKRSNLTIQALPTLGLTTVRGLRITHSQNITIDGLHVDATNSKRRGVVIAYSDGVVLRNGLVQGTGCHRSGIRIRLGNGNVLLENLGVQGCSGDGIRVKAYHHHGGQLTVFRCVVTDNQRNGLYLDKDAHVRIEGCTITNNGMKGWERRGYGVFRERQSERKRCRHHHRSKRHHWRRHHHGCKSSEALGLPVLLLGNTVTGNHGRVKKGTSDENFGNYDQMVDSADNQKPFND